MIVAEEAGQGNLSGLDALWGPRPSIAALSQTLPDLLIEQVTPLSAMSRWNCSLVYWPRWSE